MRNCLTTLFLTLMVGCMEPTVESKSEKHTSEMLVDEMRITLGGPKTLPLSVTLRGSPSYDGQRNFFTVSFKNESKRTRRIPFEELRRNVITKYLNPATGAELVHNRTPPPKRNGSVEEFAPGEIKTFQVVFEYPTSIASMKDREAVIRFCIKWESQWLRKAAYADDAFDWNGSYELSEEIRILEE